MRWIKYHCYTFTSRARYAAALLKLWEMPGVRVVSRGRGAIANTWYIDYYFMNN